MTETQTDTYKLALKLARGSFDRAKRRLASIDFEAYTLKDEMLKLRRTITALAALCSEEPFGDHLGITDACREVMSVQLGAVTTSDVVKALEEMGFDLSTQKNAHASVSAVLTRLAAKEEIERVEGNEQELLTWKGPRFDPTYDPNDIPF